MCAAPKAAFNLDYYTEVLDLQYLLEHLSEDPFFHKYKKLNEALIGLVEDYSLVSFIPLDIQVAYKQKTPTKQYLCDISISNLLPQNKESVLQVVNTVDKANGYIFQPQECSTRENLFSSAYSASPSSYNVLRF